MTYLTRSVTALACGVIVAFGGQAFQPAAAGTLQSAKATKTAAASVAAVANPILEPQAAGTEKTYHVRTDGGTAAQCNGLANTAYPGSGTGLTCAWKGPMIALPPGGNPRIAGGDTLLVHAGSYMIGFGAPGAEACSSSWPWDCSMAPVPSGPAVDRPTRILGDGYDGVCKAGPQLWGTERTHHVLSLVGTSNAEVSCMEITDRSNCVLSHTGGLACKRTSYPYGQYADSGIMASDSKSVKLSKLNIHGLAGNGVLAGRLADWTVTDVRIAANGWAGWNGDMASDGTGKGSSNSGTMRFSNWLVEYNGCGESYPEKKPIGCWGQSAGGYGDGVGTGETGGDWIIEDSKFRFNTSDGLDLLYHRLGGTVTLNRVRAMSNAGNQIKVGGIANVSNSVINGNCGYFQGKSFTYNVDNCRAVGDALVFVAMKSTDVLGAANNTLMSEGNVTITASGPTGSVLKLRNNIMVGQPYFLYPSYNSADTYTEGGIRIDESYAIKQDLRNVKCTTPNSMCANAGLIQAQGEKLNPRLTASSPARNTGLTHLADALVPTTDFISNPRGVEGGYDRGAAEMQQ